MPSRRVIWIASVISATIGFCLLVTSSLALDFVLTELKNCDSAPEEKESAEEEVDDDEEKTTVTNIVINCDHYRYVITAGSIGVIVGLIQVTSFGLTWFEKTKFWCFLHVVISILSLVSFGFGVSKFVPTVQMATEIGALTVVCRIDMIFALIVAVAVYFLKQ